MSSISELATSIMKDFKKSGGYGDRDNRGGGDRFPKRDFDSRPSFSRGGNFGGKFSKGGDDRRVEMHKATCANCGKSCEVPFRPNGEKPVYCSDCFGVMKGATPGAAYPKKEYGGRDDRGDRQDSYRKPESAPMREAKDPRIEELKSELAKANSKLDRLMDLVRANGRIPAEGPAKPVVKTEAPKAEIAKAKPESKKVEKKAEKKPAAKVVAKKKPAGKKK